MKVKAVLKQDIQRRIFFVFWKLSHYVCHFRVSSTIFKLFFWRYV